MYLGGTEIPNGNPLKVGANQVIKIMLGASQVWINSYAPTAPTGFTSSDDLDGKIEFNWALPIEQGVPVCTYEVLTEDEEVVATLGAGVKTATITVATLGTTYFVRAKNIVGSADSNESTGISQDPAGSQTFTSSGTFVKKRGWNNYNIQMIGAGAGGQGGNFYTTTYGGKAGEFIDAYYDILTTTTVTIGIGGNGGLGVSQGGAGGDTDVAKIVTADGGSGSYSSATGESSVWGTGGATGIAGSTAGKNATGYGAGGGSGGNGTTNDVYGGKGGGGKVIITWG